MLKKLRQKIENKCNNTGIDYKFVKYLIVGSANTIFAYFLYAFLLLCGLHYALAVTIQVILSICFNFFTTGRFVFKNNNNFLICKFFVVYAFIWAWTNVMLYISNLLGYHNMYIAGFVLLFPNAIISFVLMKYWVFKEGVQ